MSAPSARRLKDRIGNAAAKTAAVQKPAKPLTSFPNSSPNPISALKKSVAGKDNPRLHSRAQKPTIRPVPRVDKTAAVLVPGGDGNEGRLRWSTSSVPRGRSSSPSEFIRVFRDVKVSKGESDARLVSSSGKRNGNRGPRDGKENGGLGVGLEKKNGFCELNDLKSDERKKNVSGFRALNYNYSRGPSSSSSLIKSNELDSVGDSNCASKLSKVRLDILSAEKSGCSSKFDHLKESNGSSGTKVKILENLKEKGMIKEGACSKSGVKYPSKLHEKLAFLEGKVKRIASDIKKTKEMLDLNNPDASKVILTDIQDKISGIELAIGHVGGDPPKVVENGCGEDEVVEKSRNQKMDQVKSLVKGLNSEELEERLFPHHKLLKNRLAVIPPSESSQSCDEPNFPESKAKKLLSPAEENPIALEFLASLNKGDEKVSMRDVNMGFDSNEVKQTETGAASGKHDSSSIVNAKNEELVLTTDETLDEFDDQENNHTVVIDEETEDSCANQLKDIGTKSTTGGWFVSEGESVLLAHDDGSCSYYDITNCEEKAVYNPPVGVSHNIWRDCWIVRAPGADGCSGRYVVAASAGNARDSGFCSWDFYTKDVRAFHMEDEEMNTSRTVLGPLPSNTSYRRNVMCSSLLPESRQWWYRPCGPLIISSASSQRVVKIFDIRDGEQIMRWEVEKPVLMMDNSSPLQWRNRGKVVIAESETISVWDVNSVNQHSLFSISSSGRKISALHVINTDAELGGGVRQRVTSAEAEGNDGVFCTPDAINVLDFRHPSGIGLKIPNIGSNVQSVFTRGDSIYIGCTNTKSTGNKQPCSEVQQFSLRKQKMVGTYSIPESNAHSHCSAITQVWGNSEFVMGVSGLGLFVFDVLNNDDVQSFTADGSSSDRNVKEVIGPDDLYSPSFDYLASRVLLISRDRPAIWKHLLQ
ncbi:KIN14B-interacting protein At4g14310 [Euphorbia lathyris]|uniref:KIN14B-interacting protein At4g14310 n=1 Tax=Euphorbia lathyris TaxID=212925 RepID=UPI0033138DD0